MGLEGKRKNLSGAQDLFNTSTEASVAVNLVEGWGAKYKRARGHRSFAGDESLRKRK